MRPILRFIISLIILAIPFKSKSQSIDFDNSILWEIMNDKSESVSYILGTMHILDTTLINFPFDTVKDLIDECEVLCLEIPMSHNTTAKNFYDRNLYLSRKDSSLLNLLGTKYSKKLISIVDSSKYLLKYRNSLDSINPAILQIDIELERQLTQTCLFKKANFFSDAEFELYAKNQEYERIYLETVEQQREWLYLTDFTYDEKIQELIKTIDRFLNQKSQMDIFKQYSEQDLSFVQTDVYPASIMTLRNIGMTEKIDSLIKTKKIFIAIGAGHLPYENGVLNLLHQRGYILKPYKIDLMKN